MLLAEKKFVVARTVQIAQRSALCTKSGMTHATKWNDACDKDGLDALAAARGRRPEPVAVQAAQPLYFWFAPLNFLPLRSAVPYCRSAHSNPTVAAAQRRTDFVLA